MFMYVSDMWVCNRKMRDMEEPEIDFLKFRCGERTVGTDDVRGEKKIVPEKIGSSEKVQAFGMEES